MSKDLNIDIKSIKASLFRIPGILKKYVVVIFAVSVLSICGFLVFQINSQSNIKPTDEKITQEKQIITSPQIDEQTISKIEQLEDQNVAVQSLFKAARDNPFGE